MPRKIGAINTNKRYNIKIEYGLPASPNYFCLHNCDYCSLGEASKELGLTRDQLSNFKNRPPTAKGCMTFKFFPKITISNI